MRDLVLRRCDKDQCRVAVISNWADVENVRPEPRAQNRLLRQHGLLDKFVVQYAGNMGRVHDMEGLVRCAEGLRQHDKIHLLILGAGAKKAWLERAIADGRLTNVTVLPPFPRSASSECLNACDVAINALIPGMQGVSVPSRTYNILAAGKPIIAATDRDSELAMVIREEDVGWVVAPGTRREWPRPSSKPAFALICWPRWAGDTIGCGDEVRFPSNPLRLRPSDGRSNWSPKLKSDVLVTGAAGFLGSAIVYCLQTAGRTVRCTDVLSPPPIELPSYAPVDLTDPAAAEPLLQGVGAIIHAAGLTQQFRRSPEGVRALFAVNVDATEMLARAAVAAQIEHFVLISSVAVYGVHSSTPCVETTVCHPVDPYAKSKYEAEQAVIRSVRQSNMRVTILRLATVFGERDRGNVARLMRLIDLGRFVWIGNGSNRKTLIHRDDAARAAAMALARDHGEQVEIYNVCASARTMREVVAGLASAMQRRTPRWHIPATWARRGTGVASLLAGNRGPTASLRNSVKRWLDDDLYDGRKFQQDFGFSPQVPLAEGLRREVAWYRSSSGGSEAASWRPPNGIW